MFFSSHEIYDPCAPGSRLGTTRAQWDAAVAAHPELPALLDGLPFHTLCEPDAAALRPLCGDNIELQIIDFQNFKARFLPFI